MDLDVESTYLNSRDPSLAYPVWVTSSDRPCFDLDRLTCTLPSTVRDGISTLGYKSLPGYEVHLIALGSATVYIHFRLLNRGVMREWGAVYTIFSIQAVVAR